MEDPRQEWFDAIYLKYYESMRIAAYNLLDGHGEDADDIVQTAFEVLFEKYEHVKDHPHIRGWLFKTLDNVARNEKRKVYHQREVALEPDHIPTVEDIYFRDLASSFPPGLSESDRELLRLCFEEQLSQEEMAARLGCNVRALRERLSRAKSRYRKLYEKNLPG